MQLFPTNFVVAIIAIQRLDIKVNRLRRMISRLQIGQLIR